MTSEIRVRRAAAAEYYSVFIAALGYEQRSRHVAEQLSDRAKRKIAFAFDSPGIFSFNANQTHLTQSGFEILPLSEDFTIDLESILRSLGDDALPLGIDISSFTKFHLAQIVDVLKEHAGPRLEVDFFYAPASSTGWSTHGNPIRVAEPIHPAFASWSDDPLWPLTAIIGLGVEENLALGVAEHLDVSTVYAFRPDGSDPDFTALGLEANSAFFATDYVLRTAVYDLQDPFDLFTRLESLVYGLRPESRVAIIPLGPKIFALCALLTSIVSGRATTVWRFSGGTVPASSDVVAAGPIVSLRVVFDTDETVMQSAEE